MIRRRRAAPPLLAALFASALSACTPSGGGGDAGAAAAPCTKVGQTCEVSPGKLGSCVARDECAVAPCFVCQSQH